MTHPYATALYAQAFGRQYEPFFLKSANVWALERMIAGTQWRDAMGCYPLTPIAPEANLKADFAELRAQRIVSFVCVADPFFSPPVEKLRQHCGHVAAFKEHFIHDFSLPPCYSKHHRYEVKRAKPSCDTRVASLADHLNSWCALYQALVQKRGITGVAVFSRQYFEALCALDPVMIAAFSEDELISAHLWFEHGGVVYSHLAASSERGYALRAAYAVYDASLAYFRERGARYIDLGGGAGIGGVSAGLAFLKKGFSNGTRTAYLCGHILDGERYRALSAERKTAFFPAYRTPS